MVETDRVQITDGAIEMANTPSASGKSQNIARCPSCHVALWSHYPGAGDKIAFVRVGTLDTGHGIAPDVHIFTSTKQNWLVLDNRVPVMTEYYNRKELWPEESLERLRAV